MIASTEMAPLSFIDVLFFLFLFLLYRRAPVPMPPILNPFPVYEQIRIAMLSLQIPIYLICVPYTINLSNNV